MATRSGGTPIRTRKVKPGPDQAFTLPKGTSAAPIKQVKPKKNIIKKIADKYVEEASHPLAIATLLQVPSMMIMGKLAIQSKKEAKEKKEKKKKERAESRKKQRQGNRNNKRP